MALANANDSFLTDDELLVNDSSPAYDLLPASGVERTEGSQIHDPYRICVAEPFRSLGGAAEGAAPFLLRNTVL